MTTTSSLMAVTPRRKLPGWARPLLGIRGVLPLVVLLGAWQLFGTDNSISFPRPSTWVAALVQLVHAGAIGPASLHTLATFFGALIVATIFGSLLGTLIGWSARVERALEPLLELLRALPPPAVVPVAGLILGVSLPASIALVAFSALWPILLNVAAGVRAIPAGRIDLARSLRMSRAGLIGKILVPSLAPALTLGVRVALPIALIVTLLTEIIGSSSGLGLLLSQRQASFDAASVWGLLVLIGLFGYVANQLVGLIERRVRTLYGTGADR